MWQAREGYQSAGIRLPRKMNALLFQWMRCYRCESCADIKQLWYRDKAVGRHADEVKTSYNNLVTSNFLNRSSCEELISLQEPFVLVQNGYGFREFGTWALRVPLDHMHAVVFDKPYEIGFTRGYKKTADEWQSQFQDQFGPVKVIYTGMDTAKTSDQVRYANLCLTYAIRDARGREPRVQRTQTRFVTLINKAKPWRFWFLARLFEADLMPVTEYTTKVQPPACSFFDTSYNALKNCHTDDPRALNFSRVVTARRIDLDEVRLPRGRVHLILESQPASSEVVADNKKGGCSWEERLTEKTWEALAFGHPFLLISTNLALELVRAHGFKTFAPCLNESYAAVREPTARMRAAILEVQRLASFSDEDYWHLYDTCLKPITDFNRRVFKTIATKQAKQRLYAWGMVDTPAFDLSNFHKQCDKVAASYDIDLPKCRS